MKQTKDSVFPTCDICPNGVIVKREEIRDIKTNKLMLYKHLCNKCGEWYSGNLGTLEEGRAKLVFNAYLTAPTTERNTDV